jgi:HPt (histidine-containing phosphotransfer) domain-containing protein
MASTVDAAALARLREDMGDEATVAELVRSFLAEAPALLARMRRAARDGDAPSLRLAAHTLKSMSATFGAMALSEACKELEASARAGQVAGDPASVAAAEQEFERARVALAPLGGDP